MKKYIDTGKILNTHGVKGDLKVDSWCDSVEVFCTLKKLYLEKKGENIEYKVTKSVRFKEFVLLHLEGIDTFEEANLLKNKVIYALREDIPMEEGDYFIADLEGLPVINIDTGKVYGKIAEVIFGAASDIYRIETEKGTEALMPAVPEFVIEVDLEKGVYIRPIEGMFDEI